MRDDLFGVITVVDLRLEDPRLQIGNAHTLQPSDQLFGLTGEHRAADHFDPAAGTFPNIRFYEHDGMKSDVGL